MSVTIVTREQWGARYGRSSNRVALSSRRYFVAHYPAAAGAVTNEVATVRSIEQQHANQGWSARPGYNFLVGMSGTVYEGCGRDVQGVHCPGRNTDGIGVCFLQGGHAPKMGVQALSQAAKNSGRALYDQLSAQAGRKLTMGWHGLYFATACAGPDVIAWVRAGMPASSTAPPTTPEPAPVPPALPLEDFMFVRNPGPGNVPGPGGQGGIASGGICLCSGAGAVNLGNDWAGIQKDYEAAKVPLVLHNSQSLLARFTAIALR